MGSFHMKKSEYKRRKQVLVEQMHPRNYRSFETKLAASNALLTHMRILRQLYYLSREARSLKQKIIDWINGE